MSVKTEELINRLDPSKRQCKVCKKWFSKKGPKFKYQEEIDNLFMDNKYLCNKCLKKSIREKMPSRKILCKIIKSVDLSY